MLPDVVIIILGLVGLAWGADKFVFGASAIARQLGVSPLVIGLTIVALGTSAPEIFSSAIAALEGQPALAIGNVIGSNIFNIGMALGLAILIRPLVPPATMIRQELPVLLLVTVITGLLLIDGHLGVTDSIVLIAVLILVGYSLAQKKAREGATDEDNTEPARILRAAIYLALGLLLLILSAEALVRAATSVAEAIGVSPGIIGLTLVAMGTSLPELATTAACALRGHHDLAIGNIIGSNILNILVVLPFPGLLAAGAIEPGLVARDYSTMLIMTVVLSVVVFAAIRGHRSIGRFSGALFLLMYLGWFTLMYYQL